MAPFQILGLERSGLRRLRIDRRIPLGADDSHYGVETKFPPVLTSQGRLILFSWETEPTRRFVEHIVDPGTTEAVLLPFEPKGIDAGLAAIAGRRRVSGAVHVPSRPEYGGAAGSMQECMRETD